MNELLRSLPAIFEMLGPDNAAVEQLVFVAWRRCVDGALAENVVPVRLEGRRLIAAVTNETWRRQVSDLGPALANKVNSVLGSRLIDFIEFQVDPSQVELAMKRKVGDSDSSAASRVEPPSELTAAAEAIADESLRAIFLAAAEGSLSRGRARNE